MTDLDPRDRGGPAQPLLTVDGLVKHFPGKGGLFGKGPAVRAVDGVDFSVMKGETLGVVGESGCGKSTTARLLMQIARQDKGDIVFDGELLGSRALDLKAYRRQVQMVFQDSYASLNPRLTVEESVAFGPRAHGLSAAAALARAHDLLRRVGLEPRRFGGRYPHEVSGGQRQRVNIARALALEPRLLILDEAVSALDKSVEAQVLNLLTDLKQEFGLTYIFISHDLNVVRFMSDRVMVMYLGRIAEIGPADAILGTPRHPYTGRCSPPSPRPTRMPGWRRRRSPAIRRTRSTRPGLPLPHPLPVRGGCVPHPRARPRSGRPGPFRRLPHGGGGVRPPQGARSPAGGVRQS